MDTPDGCTYINDSAVVKLAAAKCDFLPVLSTVTHETPSPDPGPCVYISCMDFSQNFNISVTDQLREFVTVSMLKLPTHWGVENIFSIV